jgi:hypothetical protein
VLPCHGGVEEIGQDLEEEVKGQEEVNAPGEEVTVSFVHVR